MESEKKPLKERLAERQKQMVMPPKINVEAPEVSQVIEQGGSVTSEKQVKAKETEKPLGADPIKSFNIRMYESELQAIREIIATKPARKQISIRQFVMDAIEEKVKREAKKKAK